MVGLGGGMMGILEGLAEHLGNWNKRDVVYITPE
jgi:hypothetical protein